MVDISHLPVPGKTTNNLPTPSNLPTPGAEDLIPDTLEFTLFTPWGDYNWDTGLEIEKDTAAALMGFSEGLVDLGRGVEQLAVSGAENLGMDVEAQKEMMQRQKALYKEYERMDPDAFFKGEMVGFLADPVALAIPMAKAKTLIGFAKSGLITGTAVGGLSYVDEDDGETRLRNMFVGATGGMILTPAIVQLGKGISKVVSGSTKTKTANTLLDMFEETYNHHILSGKTIKEASEATSRALGLTKQDVTQISKTAGRTIKVAFNQKQAQDMLSPVLQETKDTWLRNTFGPVIDNMSSAGKTIQYAAKPILDRVRDLDPRIYKSMVENLQTTFENSHKYYTVTDNLFKIVENTLGKDGAKSFNSALFRADDTLVNKIIRDSNNVDLRKAFNSSTKMYNDIADQMEKVGIKFTRQDFYFPRVIKDRKGLFKALGSKERGVLEKIIDKAKKKAGGKLTELQEEAIINRHIFGKKPKTTKLSSTYNRKMKAVAEQYQKFYADPIEAAHSYVRSTLEEIGFRRMVKVDGKITENSFSKAVKEFASKRLKDQSQIDEMSELLTSAYYYSRASTPKWVQTYKNFTHGTLLNDVWSAATQLQDFGLTATKFTVRDTVNSVINKPLSAKEWGIVDNIAEEFVSSGGFSKKFADISMKQAGIPISDRLGKNNFINTSLNHYSRLAKTLKGRQEIYAKWKDVFGNDIHKVIDDLKNLNIKRLKQADLPQDVKTLVFAEVTDIYPVSAVTMPQAYANHPTMRAAYTLASYQVKYINFAYKNIIKQFNAGNRTKALKMLAKLTLVYGSVGVGVDVMKDIAKGREIDMKHILINNLYKIVGANKYTMDRAWDEPATTAFSAIVPATSHIDSILVPVIKTVNPDEEVSESDMRRLVSNIPGIGEIISNWFLGGAEEYNRRH